MTRELVLSSILVILGLSALIVICIISVKEEKHVQKIEKSYKEEPSGYIVKCNRYSPVLGGEVCSEFEIYNKVKVEK